MILIMPSSSSTAVTRALQSVIVVAALSSALTLGPAWNGIASKYRNHVHFGKSPRCEMTRLKLLRRDFYEERLEHVPRTGLKIPDNTKYALQSPRKVTSTAVGAETSHYLADWGIEHEDDGGHRFPNTPEKLVDEAFEAIAATIYHCQKNDPNIANNARSKSLFTTRSVRKKIDCGRIGLEIDGAKFLFSRGVGLSSGGAIRRISLMLASKLSSDRCWDGYEKRQKKKKDTAREEGYRPVVLYFNTIKQALAASQDLKWLKRAAKYDSSIDLQCLKMITIQCLADDIPEHMRIDRKKNRRRHGGLAKGIVDATRGIAIVVQPSNFNSEYKPPGPAIGTVSEFQRLASQAAIEELPFVVLSPRFMSEHLHSTGWDQSGYQKSATYGGIEPPKGPTPWIMRDFTPPAFCWVVNPMKHPLSADEETGAPSFLKVAMTQSVTDEGHQWHIYTSEQDASPDSMEQARSPKYNYLASTRSSAGRPTRGLIAELLSSNF